MEKHLSKRLRQLVMVEHPKRSLYRRIEDASGNVGTPDVYLCVDGHSVWVELKEEETANRKPAMRKGQAAFGAALNAAGGRSVVLVANKQDDTVYVLQGDVRGNEWREKIIHEGRMDLTMLDALLYGEVDASMQEVQQ